MMLFKMLTPIFEALSFAFTAVQKVFDSLGFPWLAAVTMMVLVSVVLRLFTAQFVGTAIHDLPAPEDDPDRAAVTAWRSPEARAQRRENRRLDRIVKKESRRVKRQNRRSGR